MMKKPWKRSIGAGSIMFLLILTLFVGNLFAAEAFPERPVTINIGYAPGGSASVSANVFTQVIQKYLDKKVPFIINHKPGASGMMAADYVMKQPADGYNMLWNTQDVPARLALEPEKFSFTKEDFIYVGTFGYCPFTLSVNSDSQFKTFEEFVEYAKKHPNEMTYATNGVAGAHHITGELFMKKAGIKLTLVPFIAGAQATLAMLGGHVSSAIMSPGTLMPYINAGKARALVVFDSKRFSGLPDVPCTKEKGYDIPGPTHTYNVLLMKKGTPQPVVDLMRKVFKQVAEDATAKAGMVRAGYDALYLNPAETEKLISGDIEATRGVAGQVTVEK
jgi:tripartite-type tricarboxylate transporter receptor subunit TctC